MSSEASVQRFGPATNNAILIRLPLEPGADQANSLSAVSERVEQALRAANVGQFSVINRELVGATIGRDLQQKGIWATLTAIGGILVYIAVRFRFGFAVGAVVATFHDILVTLAFLTWFGYDLTLNVVAAILTIAGYSVNDTIVVFDRVSENQRTSAARIARHGRQSGREPDAQPDHHHGRHHLPRGRVAVSLWR